MRKLISPLHPRNITNSGQGPSPARVLHAHRTHSYPEQSPPTNLRGMLLLLLDSPAVQGCPRRCGSGLTTEVRQPAGAASCCPSTSLRGPPHCGSGSCQMIGPHAINSSPCANRQNHSLFLCRSGRVRMERPAKGQIVKEGWVGKRKAQLCGVFTPRLRRNLAVPKLGDKPRHKHCSKQGTGKASLSSSGVLPFEEFAH